MKIFQSYLKLTCKHICFLALPATLFFSACNKLVSISDPTDRIVTNVAFSTDDLAEATVNGLYKTMMTNNYFSRGNATLYGALSSDELLLTYTNDPSSVIHENKIRINIDGGSGSAPTDHMWTSAYAVIYSANAVLQGIAESQSSQLHQNVRKVLTAEAKCIRAFSYFYLTNFYDAVPLVLTTDYNAVINIARSPKEVVFDQIILDLLDAQKDLPDDFSAGKGNRVRVNKWAATALLARAYLYTKDYEKAASNATLLINNTALFDLEADLNNVFLVKSREAIWQLNQIISNDNMNPTPEGGMLLPNWASSMDPFRGLMLYCLSPQQLSAFEPGDERKKKWVDSIELENITLLAYFSHKYKIGNYNMSYDPPTEYSVVLRLAEQYLIRAEAAANGAAGGTATAVADLNMIRHRAGLNDLPDDISPADLETAIAHEWQTEFFCEWGHRWFNLKRTGKAHEVLSAISYKQPWAGDYQLLYPIPFGEIKLNNKLTQNTGY